MLNRGVLVTEIRAREGAIAKVPKGKRFAYAVPISYILEDGRVIPTEAEFSRLRDAKAYRATLPETPNRYQIHVTLDAKGRIQKCTHTFRTVDVLNAIEQIMVESH